MRDLFWVADYHPLVVSSCTDIGKGSKLSPASYEGTNPILGGSTLTTSSSANDLPKVPTPNTVTSRGRVSP